MPVNYHAARDTIATLPILAHRGSYPLRRTHRGARPSDCSRPESPRVR